MLTSAIATIGSVIAYMQPLNSPANVENLKERYTQSKFEFRTFS